MDLISRPAFLTAERERYCEDCEKRKGMKNGKKRILYDIGDAPCRACEIDDILTDFEDYEAAQRWIPCSERMPDEQGDYLLYRPHFWGANLGQITVCFWSGHAWSDNYKNDAERHLPIIHGMAWMPLPDPYEEAQP